MTMSQINQHQITTSLKIKEIIKQIMIVNNQRKYKNEQNRDNIEEDNNKSNQKQNNEEQQENSNEEAS